MINGGLVVDATVHPYNLGPENERGEGTDQLRAVHALHKMFTGERHKDYMLTQPEFDSDFDLDAFSHALFAESQVDVAVLHALPQLGFTKGWLTDVRPLAELRDRHPHRYLLYGTVDTYDTDAAIRQLEWQVKEFGVVGLKLYPVFFRYDGMARGWRLDDLEFAYPLLDAARDLGIRNIAVHKAQPLSQPSLEFLRVGDLEGPLGRYPDLNFQIVHAGLAFLEETRLMMFQAPNLYANLELVAANAVIRPRLFLETIGEMLFWAKPEQILFSSGCNIVHPQPALEAFSDMVMPQDLIDERGYPELTEETKRKILGENSARLHDLDADQVLAKLKGDEFDMLKSQGLRPPWSGLRDHSTA